MDSGTAPAGYTFEGFTIDAGQRTLRHRGTDVPLPSRAFDVLVYLIDRRDRCVHKDEIIGAIWDDVVVTDDSLVHAISVLRRALGDARYRSRFIQTIPRRGYRFVADVERVGEPRPIPPPGSASDATHAGAVERAATPAAGGERRPHGMTSGTWIALAAATAALATAVVAVRQQGPQAETPPATGVLLFQPAPPETSIVSGGVLSPDGSHLAFVARSDSNGESALWIRALAGNDLRRINDTAGASKPFWSPDSERVAYFANGKLRVVEIATGISETITEVFAAAGGTWGNDDRILFAEWASGLYLVPASGDGAIEPIAELNRKADDIAVAWPQFFPDGRHFVYQIVSLTEERSGIYIGDLESDRTTKLLETESPATLVPPHHLLHVRDGMLIAEELDPERRGLTGRASVIARGLSEPTLAAENVVSASAELLAFQHGIRRQNLAWYSRDGDPLGALAAPTALYNPRISPDGSTLLVSSSVTANPGMWLARLDRDEFARLETDAIGPIWAADGLRVAFTSRDGLALTIRAVDETGTVRTLQPDEKVKILNDWSVDGRQIVYTVHDPLTGLDLWTVDVESGTARPLLATSDNETQARLSPDGRWIAYASDESGMLESYVARYPGLGERHMISVGGGGQPQWRSDLGEIFYLSLDRTVMAVEIDAGEKLGFGPPRALFRPSIAGDPGDARDYFAVDNDGTRFLIDDATSENPDQAITIMVNWSAALPDMQPDAARPPADPR